MQSKSRLNLHFLAIPIIITVFLTSALSQSGGIELAVDTAQSDQDGLFVVYGSRTGGGSLGLPVAAGDLNGDGRADLVFAEMAANFLNFPIFQSGVGQVNIYLSDGRDSGFFDTSRESLNLYLILGGSDGDLLGSSVTVGDVNDDGFSDLIMCAATSDGPANSRFNAGTAYVLPGAPHFDLSNFNERFIAIHGPQVNGRFGIWCDTGDVDGDGHRDIVIGADQLNSSAGTHVGGAYIIFGSPQPLPRVIDLAAPPPNVRISRVLGMAAENHAGATVHVADINNDGIDDLLIGAAIFRESALYVSPSGGVGHDRFAASFGGTRPRCGEAYVIYGVRDWPAEIDLRNPPATTTRLIGAHSEDAFASQLFSADINGDGKTDLIIGSVFGLAPTPDGHTRPGAVHVIYGAPQLIGATIDMAAPPPPGIHVASIYGERSGDCTGDSVRAYDINKDGRSELFIGSPDYSVDVGGQTRGSAGDVKFIFGQPDFLPPVVNLSAPPRGLPIFRLAGPETRDEFSYRMSGADMDGDGYPDLIVNATNGDGFQNRAEDAGDVYIVSGKKLSAKLGMLLAAAPRLTRATLFASGQVVQQAVAGTPGLRIEVEGPELRSDTAIDINGVTVVSRFIAGVPPGLPVHSVELDQNPQIRNSLGTLTVHARQTNPQSFVSDPLMAGTLIGPQIDSVGGKRKSSGLIVLKVSGTNFPSDPVLLISDGAGNSIAIKSITAAEPNFISAKLRAGAAAPGATLKVIVSSASGVQSNQVQATAP